MSRKLELLKNISEKLPKLDIEISDIDLEVIKNLRTNLLETSDERHSSYNIYSMIDILIITILAVLADCDEWTQIVMFAKKNYNWLNQFTNLKEGIPSKDTFKWDFIMISNFFNNSSSSFSIAIIIFNNRITFTIF